MVQPLMQEVGVRRTGVHRGGLKQKYFLDEPGRRLLLAKYDGTQERLDELMQHFKPRGIPRHTVRRWASELGLSRQKEPRWTEQEIVYLQSHLHHTSLGDIAKHLKRTKVAVRLKAKRLGINKTEEGYTMRGLMQGLGMTNHHRVLFWIEKGWLKGTRRNTDRAAQDIWYFSDAAIRDLVKNHPTEIDPRRVEWLWLVDVLLGGSAGLGVL